MRAIYHPTKIESKTFPFAITIEGEEAHHLIVTRVKEHESVLLLDGKGNKWTGVVDSVGKKRSVTIKIESTEFFAQTSTLSLLLGAPKREALERSVQIAQEYGVNKIYIYAADYSQLKKVNLDRLNKILVGALKQSNSTHLVNLQFVETLASVQWSGYEQIFYLNYDGNRKAPAKCEGKRVCLIGPEGGFSAEEVQQIAAMQNLSRLKLCDTILRTETCVSGAISFLGN